MIVQEHPYGCGVACVAEVLNITYGQALQLLGPDAAHKAETFGFYCHELTAAIRAGGRRSWWVEVQSTGPYWTSPDSIVFIPQSAQYPSGHYLSRRSGEGWTNSWSNYPNFPRLAGINKSLPAKPTFVLFNPVPR